MVSSPYSESLILTGVTHGKKKISLAFSLDINLGFLGPEKNEGSDLSVSQVASEFDFANVLGHSIQ